MPRRSSRARTSRAPAASVASAMWRTPGSASSKTPRRAPAGPRKTGSSGGPGRPCARRPSSSSYQARVRRRSRASSETWSMRMSCMGGIVRAGPPATIDSILIESLPREQARQDAVGHEPSSAAHHPRHRARRRSLARRDADLRPHRHPGAGAGRAPRHRRRRDAARAVDIARSRGLRVAPQRTGHNAKPLGALDDVLLVRTDAMQGVEIDAERRVARVRAGARWEDVIPQASALGLAALHGSTPDVSVAGYTLGGGVGWYGRRHGLAANSVTAIELVTADGVHRRVDHEH